MERSTKHRIIGILVVIALVIISLPLFQTSKDTPVQTAAIKAPPFPDQIAAQAAAPELAVNANENKPLSAASKAMDTPDDQPDDIITTLHPSVINAQQPATPVEQPVMPVQDTSLKQASAKPDTSTGDKVILGEGAAANTATVKTTQIIAPKATAMATPHALQASNNKFKKSKHQTKTDVAIKKAFKSNGLLALKNSAFVIQMGSFKNKNNALRMVNQLRANGYPAFIQKISTAFGESTRVFVGPANKRTAARTLATRIEMDMHLRGIVISYQPLTL